MVISMAKKIQINNIDELNEIVEKASRLRDQLIAKREREAANNDRKIIATLIHEKACKKEDECGWEEENNLNHTANGKTTTDGFTNWDGSEHLIYAAKVKQLLFEYDVHTITTILNIL